MASDIQAHLLLPATVQTSVVIVIAAVGLAAWVAAHVWARRQARLAGRVVAFVALAALGSASVWLLFNILARFCTLETPWRLWVCALVAGVVAESIIALYELERRTLRPATRVIVGVLRVLLLLLIAAMLVEPVLVDEMPHEEERFVAVLVDVSASMDIPGVHASASEKLALAEALLPAPESGKQPFRAESWLDEAAAARDGIAPHLRWLRLARDGTATQVERRREAMADGLGKAAAALEGLAKGISVFTGGGKLPEKEAAALKALGATLEREVAAPVRKAGAAGSALGAAKLSEGAGAILALLEPAEAALAAALKTLRPLCAAADEATLASLPEPRRKAVEQLAAKTRLAIAHSLLAGRAEAPGLIEVLDKKYTVRIYQFGSRPAETTLDRLRPGKEPPDHTSRQMRRSTDLAAALEQARADIAAGKLAGVLVLSDGRHNAAAPIEPMAQRLGVQGVAACSVLVGSTVAPPDAAVAAVKAPRSVQIKDRVSVRAEVRFNGMAGQTAKVALVRNDKVLDQKEVPVPGPVYPATVELAHTPTEPGVWDYEVRIAPTGGERIVTNNARTAYVHVTDDPTKLLLVDSRPRWEFRYLRRLFGERDKTTRLQHVLTRPDRIEGVRPPEPVHAQADRKIAEADRFPKTEKDWLGFDVIILGDVSPADLGPAGMEALAKFVGRRGGGLIVIAGTHHMPHAFAKTPLEDLMPFTFEPSDTWQAPGKGFRITLTSAGKRHVITKLDDDRELNEAIWNALPDTYWRHPVREAKPGSTVLAFAMPFEAPKFFQPTEPGALEAKERARRREAFERQNPLVVIQRHPPGRVAALTFDRTWLLRRRKGDPHHHRFWGQMLRWAAPIKLPAGSELAKLGTDRRVYSPDEPVLVNARLTGKDGSAVVAAPDGAVDAWAVVTRGKEPVLRKRLTHVATGLYEGDLGKLPTGERYRIALEVQAPKAPEVVAAAAQAALDVVVSADASSEMVDLAADRATLETLARLSVSGRAVARPDKAAGLLDRFGPGTHTRIELRKSALWHSWPLFVLMVCVVAIEWILRKKEGLT